MKTKLLLALIPFFFTFNTFSQNNFSKKSLLLGGSLNFSAGKTQTNAGTYGDYMYIAISPSAGIAVKENLFVGLNLGYSYSKNQSLYSSGTGNDSAITYGFRYGFFIRKYKPLKHNFSIFLTSDLSGSHYNYQYQSDASGKGFGVLFALTPGISFGISRRLQLEAGLNNIVAIQYSNSDYLSGVNTDNRKESNFLISTSLSNFSSQLFLGFRFLFQKT